MGDSGRNNSFVYSKSVVREVPPFLPPLININIISIPDEPAANNPGKLCIDLSTKFLMKFYETRRSHFQDFSDIFFDP
jgi:hypothetical protein